MNLKSSLHCQKLPGWWWWGRYYLSAPRSMGSFESQSISFEAWRVVRIREQPFRVLVWHARIHLVLTFINELWELARRISIFITWGVKEVHSIMKKGLGNALCNFRLYQWFVHIAKCATNECVMNSFYFQCVCLCVTAPRATSRKTAPFYFIRIRHSQDIFLSIYHLFVAYFASKCKGFFSKISLMFATKIYQDFIKNRT